MSLATETTAEFEQMFSEFVANVAPNDDALILESLDSNNAPQTLTTITEYEIDSRDARKKQLPPEVMFEVRVRESLLTLPDMLNLSSAKRASTQGTMRYQIIRPSPFWPMGLNRLWRFWLTPLEIVESDFLIDDASNFLIDDAGNSIVWDGI